MSESAGWTGDGIRQKERTFEAPMIWRREHEAGVAFTAERAPAAPVPLEWARRLRDCETQKAALRRRIEELSGPE